MQNIRLHEGCVWWVTDLWIFVQNFYLKVDKQCVKSANDASVFIVCIANHWTVVSSAKWSCGRPPSSLVCGQLLKIMKHCLTFATLTLVTSCKALLFVVGCTVTLVSPKIVYFWPVSSWQSESWLVETGVIHKGRVDHLGRLPVILPLTGDVYRMSVCPKGSAWWQTVAGRRKHICVLANLLNFRAPVTAVISLEWLKIVVKFCVQVGYIKS